MTARTAGALLQELADALRAGGEVRWAARIEHILAETAGGPLDQHTAREVLHLYGGAGTLGDVVLQPGGKVDAALNERLDRVRTEVYQAAMRAIEAKN